FFGEEVAAKMLPVESEADGVRLWGFAGHPDHTKSTRKGQYVFLNGRPVQDRSLQHALGEAYRGLTMVGRHPLAVLFWEMPPERVDVNVHPQKSEVRLEDGSSLYRQLLGTLRTKFLSVDLDGSMRLGEGKRTDGGDEHLRRPHVEPGPARPEPSSAPGLDLPWEKPVLPGSTPAFKPFPETRSGAALAVADADREGRVDKSAELPGEASAAETTAAPPRVMQVMDTYIVAETDAGLAVIDQHALHERVMYEQLRPRVLDGAVETQRLLVPAVVELPPREYALAVSEAETFAKLGFGVEDFGSGSVALTSVPAMLGDGDQSGLFKDLLDRLGEGSAATRRDSLDPLLHMMSCKAAIKAGQRLSEEEMLALLTDRDVTQDAHHCPHGRPTALVLSRQELDKRFGRLG
ncbi:MAG: DNA mismatch repair endonuclease MutL, partial [Planctomycetota bacterium]